MAVATLEMKRVNPAVARVLSGRVARTESPDQHARRFVEKMIVSVASSQNEQLKALGTLVDGDRERSELDEIAGALVATWFDELATETMCDHYATVFSTGVGGGYASGWQEGRERIFRDMRRRGQTQLLTHAHNAAHADFQIAKEQTLTEMRRVFGEELGWLLVNRGIRQLVVGWLRDAGFRFDWAGHVHQDRFNEDVFAAMIVRAPWNKNVRLSRNELLLEDAGAVLLSWIAPCTLDTLSDWLRPNIRPPRGLKKRQLRRIWEEMMVELRSRGVEMEYDSLGRMVDPAT